MKPKRLSADGQARLDFARERLIGAYRLRAFAEAAGGKSPIAPDAFQRLERDVERARQGKPIPAYDALGGRGLWSNRKDKAA